MHFKIVEHVEWENLECGFVSEVWVLNDTRKCWNVGFSPSWNCEDFCFVRLIVELAKNVGYGVGLLFWELDEDVAVHDDGQLVGFHWGFSSFGRMSRWTEALLLIFVIGNRFALRVKKLHSSSQSPVDV